MQSATRHFTDVEGRSGPQQYQSYNQEKAKLFLEANINRSRLQIKSKVI